MLITNWLDHELDFSSTLSTVAPGCTKSTHVLPDWESGRWTSSVRRLPSRTKRGKGGAAHSREPTLDANPVSKHPGTAICFWLSLFTAEFRRPSDCAIEAATFPVHFSIDFHRQHAAD